MGPRGAPARRGMRSPHVSPTPGVLLTSIRGRVPAGEPGPSGGARQHPRRRRATLQSGLGREERGSERILHLYHRPSWASPNPTADFVPSATWVYFHEWHLKGRTRLHVGRGDASRGESCLLKHPPYTQTPLTRRGQHLPEEGAHPGGCGPQPRAGAALAGVKMTWRDGRGSETSGGTHTPALHHG